MMTRWAWDRICASFWTLTSTRRRTSLAGSASGEPEPRSCKVMGKSSPKTFSPYCRVSRTVRRAVAARLRSRSSYRNRPVLRDRSHNRHSTIGTIRNGSIDRRRKRRASRSTPWVRTTVCR
uniref:Putative secreted protein n=1 Tax=Anopheles triannulatus TaxID=58253 RepID=A0A2M4B3C2_9DIPT